MSNQKIKNASPKEYNNIKFKSLLEVLVYKTLLQAGFNPLYEARKFILWEGFKPVIQFFSHSKLKNTKLINITYTPDFTMFIPESNLLVVLEAKGFTNDVFPVKFKMFRKKLEELPYNVLLFEVFNKKDILNAIDSINEYVENNKRINKDTAGKGL